MFFLLMALVCLGITICPSLIEINGVIINEYISPLLCVIFFIFWVIIKRRESKGYIFVFLTSGICFALEHFLLVGEKWVEVRRTCGLIAYALLAIGIFSWKITKKQGGYGKAYNTIEEYSAPKGYDFEEYELFDSHWNDSNLYDTRAEEEEKEKQARWRQQQEDDDLARSEKAEDEKWARREASRNEPDNYI